MRRAMEGRNRVANRMCQTMLRLVRERSRLPLVLVVGGGAIGEGVDALYADPRVCMVGTDAYVSANTRLVADGHALPFRDGVFDAVLIQAVLEHVLEPQRVADEIHRVLGPEGLVYAEAPVMQQVHEAAYDFTRFTAAVIAGCSVNLASLKRDRWPGPVRRCSGRSAITYVRLVPGTGWPCWLPPLSSGCPCWSASLAHGRTPMVQAAITSSASGPRRRRSVRPICWPTARDSGERLSLSPLPADRAGLAFLNRYAS